MLNEETIKDNFKKYIDSLKKYGVKVDDLVDNFGTALMSAPASTSTNLHNAFPGGLVDHLIKVTKYAIQLNELLPTNKKVDKNSLVKVCLLHQIGKALLYVPNKSEWHVKNMGKVYEFNNDLLSMRVGERSAFYVMNLGIELKEDEFQAIIFYDKDDSDAQSKWYGTTMSKILKIANEMAIIEEVNKD